MDTLSHPRIEDIRAFVVAKARLDRLTRLTIWCTLAACLALAFTKIAPIVTRGAGGQLESGGSGTGKWMLMWIVGATSAAILVALVMAAACAIRGAQLARRFWSCLQDPSTRNVPPLEGEAIAGMRCAESSPMRIRWTAQLHPAWYSVTMLLAAIVVLMPGDIVQKLSPLTGDSSGSFVERLRTWGSVIDWARVLLLCVLLVVLARSTFAREIACEKGPNGGRISVTLAGLLSSRTVEIPESLVRSGDPAAVARLVRPRSRGKVSQIMLGGAASRHALSGIPLHSLSGAFTTVGRWQLDRLYLSLSQRLGPS